MVTPFIANEGLNNNVLMLRMYCPRRTTIFFLAYLCPQLERDAIGVDNGSGRISSTCYT